MSSNTQDQDNLPSTADSSQSATRQRPTFKQVFLHILHKITTNPKTLDAAAKFIDRIDFCIDYIINANSKKYPRDEVMQYVRSPIVFGSWVVIITFGVCGLWSVVAPLSSASHASGVVAVDSNRKTIQHLEGGIIEQIHVKDGDFVKRGDVLITLNNTRAKATLDATLHQFYTLKANAARLDAEQLKRDTIEFDEELLALKDRPDIHKLMESQQQLLKIHKNELDGHIAVVNSSIESNKNEISAAQARLKATQVQIAMIKEQYEHSKALVKQGLDRKTRQLELEARLEELKGQSAAFEANISQSQHSINAKSLEIQNLENQYLDQITQELKETQLQIAKFNETLKDLRDTLDRMLIKAPQDGIVSDLQYHTIGGVIERTHPIMVIVPQNDKLIIDASISPNDIDYVNIGMEARIKIMAFKSRTTPDIIGKVIYVAPDLSNDQRMGAIYKIKIEIDKEKFDANPRLRKLELHPGMMADVLIINGSRTLMRYLLDPIIDSMRLGFRER